MLPSQIITHTRANLGRELKQIRVTLDLFSRLFQECVGHMFNFYTIHVQRYYLCFLGPDDFVFV